MTEIPVHIKTCTYSCNMEAVRDYNYTPFYHEDGTIMFLSYVGSWQLKMTLKELEICEYDLVTDV